MSEQENDLIILGGGCAGLSLAARLANRATELKFTVVESRAAYQYDRTWCGWRIADHPFTEAVVGSHDRWRVVMAAGSKQQSGSKYPFEVVSSEHFYHLALESLRTNANAQMLMNAEANFVTESDTKAVVRLKDGTVLRSTWVVDTRPQRRALMPPWLWQNFVGYIVTVEHPQQAGFDDVPVLMDFQQAGSSVAQYVQVLPMGDGCYLCKWMRLSHAIGEEEQIEADLVRWLTQHAGRGWQKLHRESGSLPLAPPAAVLPGRVVAAGVRGGSLRPTTGYAFHGIQRWADTCAEAVLAKKGKPTGPPPAPVQMAAEKLLLAAIQMTKSDAAHIYGAMLAKCPADALVRFLSGTATAADAPALAGGMPIGGMIASLPVLLSK